MSGREKFLLTMLSGIFIFQGLIFVQGFYYYRKAPELCPELGARYDSTFSSMTAAVIGLLAGSAMGRP